MLTRVAKTLFFVTSITPHLIVYGLAVWSDSRFVAISTIIVAILLLALAGLVLWLVRRRVERETLSIVRTENIDRDGFAFLLTYAVPLLAAHTPHFPPLAVAAFLLLVLMFVARAEMLWVNPLLVVLGFHALKVIASSENTYLLFTKMKRQPGKRELAAIRLTDVVWLEE